MITELNDTTFDEFVKAHDAVLVDLWATWCGPCRMLSPLVEQLAEQTPALTVAKVDVDACPELCRRFGISAVPTLLLFKNGQLLDQTMGYQPLDSLKSFTKAALGSV